MRARRPVTAALALATVAALVGGPAAAQEDAPSSGQVERRLSSAEARLAELEAEASLAVEEVNAAQLALDDAEAELAATTAAAEAATARTRDLREATDAVARALYKTGGTNLHVGALLSADGPTEVGARYATIRRVLDGHRGDVEELRAAITELDTLEAQLAEQRDAAAERAADLELRRTQLQTTLDDQADDIARLEAELAEVREREEAERAAAEAAAREAAAREEAARAAAAERRDASEREAARREEAQEAAPPTRSPSSGGGTSGSGGGGGSTPPAPSTRQSAQVAVDTAVDQVGKPYQWGGSGPDSYDCSGLTAYGWRAAGVTLPHSSRAQFSATSRISRGDLQPGDLIFFGSPIHHVAMYIGGGDVVEASRAGTPVRISSTALGRSDIAGYGRP